MECEPPNVILELQRKIALLETQLANCQEKISEAEKENAALVQRQFSLDKIKDDNAAVLFYTGFPSYEALISFYKYIEPKLSKMQYWKGENQDDENKHTPGPSRKLIYLDGFLLVLIKTSHMLDGTLPNTLSPYATQIATVCGLLTNFLPPLLLPGNPSL